MKGSGGATQWPRWHVVGGALVFGTALTLVIAGFDAAEVKGRTVAFVYLAIAFLLLIGSTLATKRLWLSPGRPRWRVLIALLMLEVVAFASAASYVAQRPTAATSPGTSYADLQVEGISARPPTKAGEVLIVAFKLRNNGDTASTSFRRVTAVAEQTREQSIGEIDQLFERLYGRIVAIPPAATNEIRPGETVEIDLVGWEGRKGHPDGKAWQRQASGASRIYTAALYQYREARAPSDEWISVEVCVAWFENEARVCPAHNRTVRP